MTKILHIKFSKLKKKYFKVIYFSLGMECDLYNNVHLDGKEVLGWKRKNFLLSPDEEFPIGLIIKINCTIIILNK